MIKVGWKKGKHGMNVYVQTPPQAEIEVPFGVWILATLPILGTIGMAPSVRRDARRIVDQAASKLALMFGYFQRRASASFSLANYTLVQNSKSLAQPQKANRQFFCGSS